MNKKKIFSPLFIIPLVLAIGALTVLAFSLYRSPTRYNYFEEGSVSAQIAENDNEPTEAITTELTPTPTEEDGKEFQVTAKKVTTKNNSKNDAYVRVKLLPGWVDEEGNIVGTLGTLSNFDSISLDSGNPATSIILTDGISCTLDSEWSKYWSYNANDGTFLYKTIVGADKSTQPLITQVVMTQEVYETAQYYNVDFRLDVLADVLQYEGELAAKSDREFVSGQYSTSCNKKASHARTGFSQFEIV